MDIKESIADLKRNIKMEAKDLHRFMEIELTKEFPNEQLGQDKDMEQRAEALIAKFPKIQNVADA